MDVFSLEEDDGNELFITKEPCEEVEMEAVYMENVGDIVAINSNGGLLPCSLKASEGKSDVLMYSDISDPKDDFVNPIYGRTNR